MIYIVVNVIFALVALIGLFLIDRLDEGFAMGINGLRKLAFLYDLGLVAIGINVGIWVITTVG